MNKGFEAIEIMHLFGLGHKAIEILIHPQSIVHSAVEFLDGSVLAQMAPAGHAAAHPVRPHLPRARRRASSRGSIWPRSAG